MVEKCVFWEFHCPYKDLAHALLVNDRNERDKHSVFAFIRFKCNDTDIQNIPVDIIRLIDEMYGGYGRIHLFFDGRKHHFAINVRDIFTNCNFKAMKIN